MTIVKKYSFFTFFFALLVGFTIRAAEAQVQEQAQAQEYKLIGRVVDANTGEAIPEVKIVIMAPRQQAAPKEQTQTENQQGMELQNKMTEMTNEQGHFTFEELPSGEHKIKVARKGYETWERTVNLNQDSQLTIELQPSR